MVTSVITVEGNGSAIERSSAMGTPDFRIFAVYSSGNLTLQETTISGGRTSGDFQDGGGVYNYGALTVTNSTISGNSTSGNFSEGGGYAYCEKWKFMKGVLFRAEYFCYV